MAIPTALVVLAGACSTAPPPADVVGTAAEPPGRRIAFNDNLEPAGRLHDGVLELRLAVREGDWYLLGDQAEPGRGVLAFGEPGRPPQIPGPMLRVPLGTRVRVVIDNPLDSELVVHGLSARLQEELDSLVVPPRATAEARFVADAVGTYYYWGTTTGARFGQRYLEDSQLGGAFIVDPPEGSPPDRVLVMGIWVDGRDENGRPDFWAEFLVINGRPWPHTERLRYSLGDTIRWRVINASADVHPMHLHGFYFRVDARGDLARDTIFWPAERRMAVTERMRPGRTMTMVWSPDRPGGWLFHCHLTFHVLPNPGTGAARESREAREATVMQGHPFHDPHRHLEHGMGGLLLVTEVEAPDGWALNEPTGRELRLYVQSAPTPDGSRRFAYVLQEHENEPAADSLRLPGPTLVLRRGEPTSIRVVNRSAEPTQVHWHGLEVQSYFDGAIGVGGHRGSATPAILPGESFEVRITPPRAGSFMYHTHMNEVKQQGHGLYGAIVVLEPDEVWDPVRDIVLLAGSASAMEARPLLNGRVEHEPRELRVGETYRLRLMNVTLANPALRMRLMRDGVAELWNPLAKDGHDLPPSRRVPRAADQEVTIGETFDFLYTPDAPGELAFELRAGNYRLFASKPMKVLAAEQAAAP